MRKFTKIEIAAIKRTAQNVATFVTKKAKIDEKIAELEEEKKALQPMIDAFQGPIKEMTGGYTTEQLVVKETVKTGKMDPKSGKEIYQSRYVLRYPETVVPPVEETLPNWGNDYDVDAERLAAENEVEVLGTAAPDGDDVFADDTEWS